jgi:hypothetical protein
MIDEQFKADVRADLRAMREDVQRLMKLLEGDDGDGGLSAKVDHLSSVFEGGKAAASIVRWLAAVAIGCAAAFAWVIDHWPRITK